MKEPDDSYGESTEPCVWQDTGNCEQCKAYAKLELIPLMGYSLWMCRKCAAAAYRSGEAV